MKICRGSPNLVKIRKKWWALYMNTEARLWLPTTLNRHKNTCQVTWWACQAARIAEKV